MRYTTPLVLTDVVKRHVSARGVVLVLAFAALGAAFASAQPRRGRGGPDVRMASGFQFDGSFNFCRVAYRGNRFGDGGGWGVDYPRADINLSIRLGELTKSPVSFDSSGEPNHLVVRLTDPELFQCPFVMMTEVGAAYFTPEEASQLRDYLVKGGFLWVDDFWGSFAWRAWLTEFAKVLSVADHPIEALTPEHPMFRTLFEVKKVPQIPSINFWAGSGGRTSERGGDSATPEAWGVFDDDGRVMVLMTHNTDVGDSWEREADDPDYFYRFSVDGYAFGVNVLMYAMSH